MSGNFAIKGGGGGGGPLMANAILNFHFDFLHTLLTNTYEFGQNLLHKKRQLISTSVSLADSST